MATETIGSSGAVAKRAKAPISAIKPGESEAQVLRDRIETRAYQLYEQRGRQPGRQNEDWLQAEEEVLSEGIDTDLG